MCNKVDKIETSWVVNRFSKNPFGKLQNIVIVGLLVLYQFLKFLSHYFRFPQIELKSDAKYIYLKYASTATAGSKI